MYWLIWPIVWFIEFQVAWIILRFVCNNCSWCDDFMSKKSIRINFFLTENVDKIYHDDMSIYAFEKKQRELVDFYRWTQFFEVDLEIILERNSYSASWKVLLAGKFTKSFKMFSWDGVSVLFIWFKFHVSHVRQQ